MGVLWSGARRVRERPPCSSGAEQRERKVEHTELFGIDLRHDGGIELGYSFDREVGWDDAMFNIAIEDWTPRPVSLDD